MNGSEQCLKFIIAHFIQVGRKLFLCFIAKQSQDEWEFKPEVAI